MMLFQGHVEITEVEKLGLHEVGFEIAMIDDSTTEVNTCKEITQTIFALYTVYQDITSKMLM